MDFPNALTVGSGGSLSWFTNGPNLRDGSSASNTQTANAAIYMQCFTPVAQLVSGFGWYNGAAVSGNVDVGIYDVEARQLGHTGSTAQAGTNAAQTAAPSGGAFWVPPGTFYIALAIDNATGAFFCQSSTPLQAMQALGIFGQASAFPLPATAVFAAPSQTRMPFCAAFTEGSTF